MAGDASSGAPPAARGADDDRERRFDLARTIALSDGIFAFALTLLVLSLTVPVIGDAGSSQELVQALSERSSELISWLISFAVIGGFWMRHTSLTRRLTRVDGTFVVLNLVFLALIALVPYPTELLGRYSNGTSFAFYALVISLLVVINAVEGDYAISRGLTDKTEGRVERRARLIDSLSPAAVFLASIPVALAAGTLAGYLCWLAVIPVNIVTGRAAERARGS